MKLLSIFCKTGAVIAPDVIASFVYLLIILVIQQSELTMNGFTGLGGEELQPPLKKGFLLPNKSLVAVLWNGFLLFTLLLSSEKKINVIKKNAITPKNYLKLKKTNFPHPYF